MKKIFYITTILSLIPIILTYFGWGSPTEIIYMIIMFLFFIGLILITIDSSPFFAWGTLVVGILTSLILLSNLKELWFDNEGGDKNVVLVFTIQWIVMFISLIFICLNIKSSYAKISK
jgi:hypothetical protein